MRIIADASQSEPQLTDRSTGAVINGERAVREYIKIVNSEVRPVPRYSSMHSWRLGYMQSSAARLLLA